MDVCWAMVLISDAKQATSEKKSGPVETELTGPAATTLRVDTSIAPDQDWEEEDEEEMTEAILLAATL